MDCSITTGTKLNFRKLKQYFPTFSGQFVTQQGMPIDRGRGMFRELEVRGGGG